MRRAVSSRARSAAEVDGRQAMRRSAARKHDAEMALDSLAVVADRTRSAASRSSAAARLRRQLIRSARRQKMPDEPRDVPGCDQRAVGDRHVACCAMPSTAFLPSRTTRRSVGSLPVIHPGPMGSVPAMMPRRLGSPQAACAHPSAALAPIIQRPSRETASCVRQAAAYRRSDQHRRRHVELGVSVERVEHQHPARLWPTKCTLP